jgi:hypothetical protein
MAGRGLVAAAERGRADGAVGNQPLLLRGQGRKRLHRPSGPDRCHRGRAARTPRTQARSGGRTQCAEGAEVPLRPPQAARRALSKVRQPPALSPKTLPDKARLKRAVRLRRGTRDPPCETHAVLWTQRAAQRWWRTRSASLPSRWEALCSRKARAIAAIAASQHGALCNGARTCPQACRTSRSTARRSTSG